MRILHHLPGRMRLSVPTLWRKEDAILIRGYLESLHGVSRCIVNHRRSSVMVHYDPASLQGQQIMDHIVLMMQYLQQTPNEEKQSLLAHLSRGSMELQGRQNSAAKKVITFGVIYLLYKWKQANYGKFALSRSVPVLQVASLITIIGGYPLLKSYYKKYTKELPGDSEDILKQSAVFSTLIRESAKGVFVLVLKTLNDWLKFTADTNNYSQWQWGQENLCSLYAVQDKTLKKMLPPGRLQIGDKVVLSAGQFIPTHSFVTEGQAIVEEAEGRRICRSGDYIHAGRLVQEGQVKLKILHAGSSHEERVIYLDDVHQPETPYQQGITRVALSGALISCLLTGSILNAMAVLLLMSPSAGNAAVSSGLNNCVYRLSRRKVIVPAPNCLMGISECRHLLLHPDLYGGVTDEEKERLMEEIHDLGLQLSILNLEGAPPLSQNENMTWLNNEDVADYEEPCILVRTASSGREFSSAYTILFDASAEEDHADMMVLHRRLSELPVILEEVYYARKVFEQSLLFTKAFNIWYGVNAIVRPFDAFAAKSLNTINSVVALLSNQRILLRKL